MGLPTRLVHAHVATGAGERPCYNDTVLGDVTYRQLSRAVHRYAQALRRRGVASGGHGLVVADDMAATAVAILGMWAHGSIPVPVSPLLTEAEIEFIGRDCAATLVHVGVAEPRRSRLLAALGPAHITTLDEVIAALTADGEAEAGPAREEERPDEEVLLQYTSGSTGVPKGVRQSLRGLLSVIDGYGTSVPLRSSDRVLSTAKMSFGYGFGSSVLWTLAAGAQAVLLTGPAYVHTVISAIRRHHPTVLCTVPRMYGLLAEHVRDPGDLASVRLGLSAGEHLPAALARRFADSFGTPLINALGATEVGHIVLVSEEPASLGIRPVRQVTASVRDEQGRELPAGEPGRLHIAGPSVALGYLGRRSESAAVFADGGAYTGDIAQGTGDGRLAHLCRADDLLNLGGFKVAPAEIEAVAQSVSGVTACAVVGLQDESGLDQVVAYVVPGGGMTPSEVRRAVMAAVRDRLAAYKRPSRVEMVGELPVSSAGKLARYRLRIPGGQP